MWSDRALLGCVSGVKSMIAECYVLTIQCDQPYRDHTNPVRAEFTGRNKREAWSAAKKEGWLLTGIDGALCPMCASFKKRKEQQT